MIDHAARDGVQLVTMGEGENRFNLPFVATLLRALDDAERAEAPLVLTGHSKFFSNGLDLEWLAAADEAAATAFFGALHELLARLLVFPQPTAAAINGHAFGAGAMLAAATDFRVMRADRGYFCFPEVDLGMSMTPQFESLCRAKFPTPSLLRAWTSGTRYPAEEARALGFVDDVCEEERLLERAAALVAPPAGKDPATMSSLKRNLYGETLAILEGD